MEPISALAAGYATDKLIEVTESAVRTHVIERWARRRARQFFEAFCKAVAGPATTEEQLKRQLDELLGDERRSEILFDAYRSVCLTRSKKIGPRVIALLTAELVANSEEADDSEVAMFAAAEELTDSELEEFSEFALRHFNRATDSEKDDCTLAKNGALSIQMQEETFTSSWHRDYELSVAPLDLANDIGTWARKLKRHGLVSDDVKERHWAYREDSERYIDEDGTAREVSWWLFLAPEAKRFAELIQKAS